jgi:hypothetical protein
LLRRGPLKNHPRIRLSECRTVMHSGSDAICFRAVVRVLRTDGTLCEPWCPSFCRRCADKHCWNVSRNCLAARCGHWNGFRTTTVLLLLREDAETNLRMSALSARRLETSALEPCFASPSAQAVPDCCEQLFEEPNHRVVANPLSGAALGSRDLAHTHLAHRKLRNTTRTAIFEGLPVSESYPSRIST